MLSIEQMRRWCLAHTSRNRRNFGQHNREFSTFAFLRALGMQRQNFYNWMHGNKPLYGQQPRLMSKFIEDWEAGLLEFVRGPKSHDTKRILRHRSVPKKMPIRMVVDITGGSAKLRMLGKPVLERMPDFPSLSGALSEAPSVDVTARKD